MLSIYFMSMLEPWRLKQEIDTSTLRGINCKVKSNLWYAVSTKFPCSVHAVSPSPSSRRNTHTEYTSSGVSKRQILLIPSRCLTHKSSQEIEFHAKSIGITHEVSRDIGYEHMKCEHNNMLNFIRKMCYLDITCSKYEGLEKTLTLD